MKRLEDGFFVNEHPDNLWVCQVVGGVVVVLKRVSEEMLAVIGDTGWDRSLNSGL